MAVSTDGIGPLLTKELGSIFRRMDDELRTTWAVYTEFNHEQWRYDVTGIVPWADRFSSDDLTPFTFKIEGAIDEMDAYKKFIEGHK